MTPKRREELLNKLDPKTRSQILAIEAKNEERKQQLKREKYRLARERRNVRIEFKKRGIKFDINNSQTIWENIKDNNTTPEDDLSTENNYINQTIEPEINLKNNPQVEPDNNQKIEDKNINQEINKPQINQPKIESISHNEIEVKIEPIINQKIEDTFNKEVIIVNESQPITNQPIEDKSINQEATIVNEPQPINQPEITQKFNDKFKAENESINNPKINSDFRENKEVDIDPNWLKEAEINQVKQWIEILINPLYQDQEFYEWLITTIPEKVVNLALDKFENRLEIEIKLASLFTNDIEIEDYKTWISIALQSSFYIDNEGKIPVNWQQLAKKYYHWQFTNNDEEIQDIIDEAIALLDDEDKTLLNQIINLNDDSINQLPPLTNTEDILVEVKSDNLTDISNQANQEEIKSAFSDTLSDKLNDVNQEKILPIKSGINQLGYQLIENEEDLLKAIAFLSQEKILGIDIETTGLDPHRHKIRLIQIASYNHPTVIIDCFKCEGRLIQPILANDSIKIAHNAKFEVKMLMSLGLEFNQSIFCTMLAHQLITAGKSNVDSSLKAVAKKFLNIELSKDEQKSDWSKEVLTNSQLEYASKDAEILLPLREKLREEIIKHELTKIAKIEFDCLVAVAQMEFNGMLLDVGKWQEILKEAVKQKEELNLQLQQLLPQQNSSQLSLDFTNFNYDNNSNLTSNNPANQANSINNNQPNYPNNNQSNSINNNQANSPNNNQANSINNNQANSPNNSQANSINNNNQSNFSQFGRINLDSSKQLLEALNRAGINVKDTNSKTLQKLLNKYPEILKPLLEYKKVSKLISSFGDRLLKKINVVTGRLHGEFNQLGSEAGRFTCKNPNVQQIPREKAHRECFVARPTYKLVIADYSQIELRIAAELTNDKTMISAYNNGEDLHKLTASIVLNKPLEEVTKEDRQLAKACNFGLIYGQGVTGFRSYTESHYGISLTEKEAKKIMDNFFKSYQGLSKWHKATKSRIYRQGVSETRTLSGRVRYFDNPSPQKVLNTPVQGTGADMLKLALGKLVTALKGYDCRILATVHDEIILEAHESIASEVANILSTTMVEAGKEFLLKVPVEAEASIGDNWADK